MPHQGLGASTQAHSQEEAGLQPLIKRWVKAVSLQGCCSNHGSWKIDRQVITAAAAIAIVAGSIGIWNYPPARNFLSRRQTFSIEISARDDLTAILQKKFKARTRKFSGYAWTVEPISPAATFSSMKTPGSSSKPELQKRYRRNHRCPERRSPRRGATARIQAILAQAHLFRYYLIEGERDKSEAVKLAGEAEAAPESPEVMVALGEVFNAIGWQRDAIQTLTAWPVRNTPAIQMCSSALPELTISAAMTTRGSQKYYQATIDARFKQDGQYFWSDYNELGAFYFSRGKYEMAVWN